MRERNSRSKKLALEVIAACVDKAELQEGGVNFLFGNYELGIDVLTMLDAIKHQIQMSIGVNLNSLNINNEVTPPPPSSQSTLDVDSNNTVDVELEEDDRPDLEAAIHLLANCSRNRYNDLVSKFIKSYNIPKAYLPSYHLMTKDRPKVVTFEVIPSELPTEGDLLTESLVPLNNSSFGFITVCWASQFEQ